MEKKKRRRPKGSDVLLMKSHIEGSLPKAQPYGVAEVMVKFEFT